MTSEPDSLPKIVTSPEPPFRPPTSSSSAPPRLGIGHLLLIMACVGAGLALWRREAGEFVGVLGVVYSILFVMGSLATGAAWAGLIIFVSRRIRGVPWPIQPGEWLLACFGAHWALGTLLHFGLKDYVRSVDVAAAAFMPCLLLLPALSNQEKNWRVFFWLLIAIFSLELVQVIAVARLDEGLTWFWATWQQALLAALVVVWVLKDRRAAGNRDWLHWLGVAVPLWVALLVALAWLLSTYVV